jgi:hypothetical protein
LAEQSPPATQSDDDLWHNAGIVNGLAGGNPFDVPSVRVCDGVVNPDAGRAYQSGCYAQEGGAA